MDANKTYLTWPDIEDAAAMLAERHAGNGWDSVYGIPQGGAVPAVMVARHLNLPLLDEVNEATLSTLVVDDLVDSGVTASRFPAAQFDALYRKPHSPTTHAPDAVNVNGWAVFPWEADPEPTDAIVRLLEHIGEDPTRDGLLDTPARVLKAMRELTAGYSADIEAILARQFDHHHDQMIVVTRIPFVSLCEHHLLPFTGHATVGYIPGNGRVVGLSKLARIVDAYARRLQLQERLTDQVADALLTHLDPDGVGVVVTATHACLTHRGAQATGAAMTTSALHGAMRDKPEARAEFLALHQP